MRSLTPRGFQLKKLLLDLWSGGICIVNVILSFLKASLRIPLLPCAYCCSVLHCWFCWWIYCYDGCLCYCSHHKDNLFFIDSIYYFFSINARLAIFMLVAFSKEFFVNYMLWKWSKSSLSWSFMLDVLVGVFGFSVHWWWWITTLL